MLSDMLSPEILQDKKAGTPLPLQQSIRGVPLDNWFQTLVPWMNECFFLSHQYNFMQALGQKFNYIMWPIYVTLQHLKINNYLIIVTVYWIILKFIVSQAWMSTFSTWCWRVESSLLDWKHWAIFTLKISIFLYLLSSHTVTLPTTLSFHYWQSLYQECYLLNWLCPGLPGALENCQ